ncbi:MAG TPA: hypothetical protein VFQ53_41430 [Kofleriaceae bacterium]|nr:hypothetical protein [Kofleriaceae bacterium]
MSDFETIDARTLGDVTGGAGILAALGQGALSGALQGAAGAIQNGRIGNGGILKGMLAGGIQGLAGTAAAAIQGGGQQAA